MFRERSVSIKGGSLSTVSSADIYMYIFTMTVLGKLQWYFLSGVSPIK